MRALFRVTRAKKSVIVMLLAFLAVPLGTVHAQLVPGDTTTIRQMVARIARLAANDSLTARRVLAEGVDLLAGEPALLNRGLDVLEERGGLRLLQHLDVRFVTFEAEESELRGLGLSYALNKDLTRSTLRMAEASHLGLATAVKASGNVAFDRRINPRNFLTADASLHLYGSRGGVWSGSATTDAERTRLNQLETEMAAISTLPALLASPATKEFLAFLQSRLTTHVYWDVAATARVESDQSFGERQNVFGGVIGLVVDHPRPIAANVFDWPAAVVRFLTGYDRVFSPRGSSLPTVQLELASVDPKGDEAREALGETAAYPRLRFETGLRTPLLGEPDGRRVFLDAGYRVFREIGASEAIAQADLHQFDYLVVAVVSSSGPYASYSSGRLPFDRRDDQVYEIGFKFDF